jgi:hypothetical protein
MVPFSHLLNALETIPDPRRAQGQRYPFSYLLLFTVLALLSGASSYEDIIAFFQDGRETLNRYFGVNLKRAPVVNTLRVLLQNLNAMKLEGAFQAHAKILLRNRAPVGSPTIALDGKVLRGSFDNMADKRAAQVLTAFASEAALVLAHTEIDEKSNEIPAAEQMIRDLGLTGVVFTADPIHCQKNTSLSRETRETTFAETQ